MKSRAVSSQLRAVLGFNVTRAAVLLRRRFIRALDAWSMSPEQWQVLVSVAAEQQEISQNDVAQITLKDRHAVSKMIDRLERDGWLVRKPHSGDPRAYALEATAKTRREMSRMRGRLDEAFDPVFERLEPERRRLLLELLGELIEILELEE